MPRPSSLAALLTVTLAASLASSRQPSSAALINEQLDKPVELDVTNQPLPQVLATIEDRTGVPVRPSDDLYDVLPYGRQTPITAKVQHLPLRKALAAISATLGLRVDLRDQHVELSPAPALRRLGRRATVQELRTLDLLAQRPLDPPQRQLTIAGLVDALDARLMALDAEAKQANRPSPGLAVEYRPSPDAAAGRTLTLSRRMTPAEALDLLDAETPLTWYPWGDSVVVVPKRTVWATLLDRPLTLRYDGVELPQVLLDLSRRSGVPFAVEPGAVQRVPPAYRTVRLSAADGTVRQALESLQGSAGLTYAITDDGVHLATSPANSSTKTYAIEAAPGVQLLVPEGQLPPELRSALQASADAKLRDLAARLKPTTQPTP